MPSFKKFLRILELPKYGVFTFLQSDSYLSVSDGIVQNNNESYTSKTFHSQNTISSEYKSIGSTIYNFNILSPTYFCINNISISINSTKSTKKTFFLTQIFP
ncbi:unnamed protein product [Schistosoma spindalis]|nr:unnamed protein product [Schistosoma spindale]